MAKSRQNMTARVVAQGSREAGDPRMGGTITERVAAVAELTRLAWAQSRRPLPSYTRASMPVVVTTLAKHAATE